MILAKVDELEGRLRNLKAAQSTEQTQNVWRHHAQEFDSALKAISQPISFLQWLEEDSGTAPMPDLTSALSFLRRLRESLQSDPDSVLRGPLLVEAKSMLQQALNALEDAARTGWRSYVTGLPPQDAELFAPFEDQQKYRDLVHKARMQDQNLANLVNRPYLQSGEDRAALQRLLAARLETRAKLPSVKDEEIQAFVQSAAGRGATLAALTPKIVEWLRDSNLEESYVIRKRGTPGASH